MSPPLVPLPSFDVFEAWKEVVLPSDDSSSSSSPKKKIWSSAVERLLDQDGGSFTTLSLPTGIVSSVLKDSWNVVAHAFDTMHENPSIVSNLNETSDSAHCTGYHLAAAEEKSSSSSSLANRYNAFRRGLVMSDGAWTCPIKSDTNEGRELAESLNAALLDLFHIVHYILEQLLQALADHWGLPSRDWFQDKMGPTRDHSQWHVKEFILPPPPPPHDVPEYEKNSDTLQQSQTSSLEEQEWLPAHTDPSLLSVVIHDRNHGATGAEGLQYYHKNQWHNCVDEMMKEEDEDDGSSLSFVAVVFVGSVLSAMTGVPACRHRVVYHHPPKTSRTSSGGHCHRRAVTLFGRPSPMSRIQIPPSPHLARIRLRQEGMLFKDWLARVARNYEKSKQSSKAKQKGNSPLR